MKILAIIVAVSATFLIQWHSMGFWTSQTGSVGIVWSIAFEIAVLWLWWQDKIWLRLTGLAGTVVLLSASLYMVSQPVVDSYFAAHTGAKQEAMLNARLADLKADKDKLYSLADKRSGWKNDINVTDKKIEGIYAELDAIATGDVVEVNGKSAILLAVEILAMVIIAIAQVVAIRYLSGEYHAKRALGNAPIPTKEASVAKKVRAPRKTAKKKIAETSNTLDSGAVQATKPLLSVVGEEGTLRLWLESYIEQQGSIRRVSDNLGIDRREVGYARNKSGRAAKEETWLVIKSAMESQEVMNERKHAA